MDFLLKTPDRVAFTVFGIDIMWYGLLIGIGMVVAVVLSYRRAPKHGLNSERVLDVVAGAGGPREAIPCSRSGGVAVKRYHSSKVKRRSCALLEQP